MFRIKNALRVNTLGAFFMAITLLVLLVCAALSPAMAVDCQPQGRSQVVTVAHIYDGDTVRLHDGRRVRLLGINTPELGRNGAPNQDFAIASKRALEDLLGGQGKVYLYTDVNTDTDAGARDKYGRFLAYLVLETPEGRHVSLEKELLVQGLAYHVAVPPNLELAECFAEAEKLAQNTKRGLWSQAREQGQQVVRGKDSEANAYATINSRPIVTSLVSHGGYQRITARVARVTLKKAWWITFNEGFTAVIYPEYQRYFDRNKILAWQGQRLVVEGWVYKSSYQGKPQWRVKLETPYAVSEFSTKTAAPASSMTGS